MGSISNVRVTPYVRTFFSKLKTFLFLLEMDKKPFFFFLRYHKWPHAREGGALDASSHIESGLCRLISVSSVVVLYVRRV